MKHFLLTLILTPFAILGAADPAPAPSNRLAGAAAVDITPDYPVRLSGYGSRRDVSQGVAQHLFAKALAIGSDEEGPAVLVTVDNCGVPAAMRDEVVRRLGAKTKVRDERFAIASSHTHCAPMLTGVLPNLFSMDIPAEHLPAIERYTRELTDKIEQVALAALADRKPASLAWGVGKVGFAANRRNFALKPVDHDLPVLRVTGPDGKVRAIFTSYACHCTTIGIESMHGDWAGCAQEALQREFPGAVALTALGCGADQNPNPRRTMELVLQYGEAVGAEAKRLANGELTPVNGPLECRTKQIELAYDKLPTREEWQVLAESKTAGIAYHAKKNLARLDRGERIPTHLPYLVQVWSFGGDLAMVFLPGEVVVDYSLRIKRDFDRSRIWVNGYSNDVPCYIPSRRVLEEGGYEGAGAMVYYDRPTKFAPDVEERIIGAVHDLMPRKFLAAPDARESAAGKRPLITLPVRVHLVQSETMPAMQTTLLDSDVTRIIGKVNSVWAQAGIGFEIESVGPTVALPPGPELRLSSEFVRVKSMIPKGRLSANAIDICYVKEVKPNGFYYGEPIVVKDSATLREVPGGLDEPLPRVTSHEIGHALGLKHRQDTTNLMQSGTTGFSLNEAEIATARARAVARLAGQVSADSSAKPADKP